MQLTRIVVSLNLIGFGGEDIDSGNEAKGRGLERHSLVNEFWLLDQSP